MSGANTDEEIATILGVCVNTLHSWKLQNEEFTDALRRTKEELIELVEGALLKRAEHEPAAPSSMN